ncbi:MAG: putative bifunctional diguanylate cyclase/phosphodiesterase [Solirubrobacteraceae bacterium]
MSDVHEELQRRVLEQSAVARLGELALESADPHALMEAAAETVAQTLDVQFAGALELNDARDRLVSRAGFGWPEGIRGEAYEFSEMSHAGYTLTVDEPVVVEDFATEDRFDDTELFTRLGIRSGVSVRIRGKAGPLGVFGAHSVRPREFTQHRLSFLQSVANILGAAMERAAAEERLRHQALHDELTGLPNRTLLFDRLEHALGRRDRGALALLFVDLDDFKIVNDTLGHQVGDELLRDIAPRIAAAVRPSDTVARFGGDEFVILCEELAGNSDAIRVAARVRQAFEEPFVVGGMPRQITASIGVAVDIDGVSDPSALIRDADAAVYRAKDQGRGWIETHDEAAHELLVRRVEVEQEMRESLDAHHFAPFYQPVVDLARNGVAVSWEALARWPHPQRGMISPAGFIDIAEETGLIIPLGEQILRRACETAAGWPDGNVAVNVSPRQLAAGDLGTTIVRVLAETGLPPARLTIELTETALFDTTPMAVRSLLELGNMGVHLVLDDFGTGYSSLSHLRRFRVDAVKIDRSFIAGIEQPGHDQTIVRAVLSMAHEMEIEVVAEGVETIEQAELLHELGCPLAQGYLFGHPEPVAASASSSWADHRVTPG